MENLLKWFAWFLLWVFLGSSMEYFCIKEHLAYMLAGWLMGVLWLTIVAGKI